MTQRETYGLMFLHLGGCKKNARMMSTHRTYMQQCVICDLYQMTYLTYLKTAIGRLVGEQRVEVRLPRGSLAAQVVGLVDDPDAEGGGGGGAQEAVEEDEAAGEEAHAGRDVGCRLQAHAQVAERRHHEAAAVQGVHGQGDVQPKEEELQQEGEGAEGQPEVGGDHLRVVGAPAGRAAHAAGAAAARQRR